jgi:NTP pyrophosphatase (non-canonical NTP hydrolase)
MMEVEIKTALVELTDIVRRDWLRDERYWPPPVAGQRKAPPERLQLWTALGLCGEAGEVGDVIKKAALYRDDVSDPIVLDEDEFLNECGDTLHFLLAALEIHGYTLEDAAAANVKKMNKRFPNGKWNAKDALAKADQRKEKK